MEQWRTRWSTWRLLWPMERLSRLVKGPESPLLAMIWLDFSLVKFSCIFCERIECVSIREMLLNFGYRVGGDTGYCHRSYFEGPEYSRIHCHCSSEFWQCSQGMQPIIPFPISWNVCALFILFSCLHGITQRPTNILITRLRMLWLRSFNEEYRWFRAPKFIFYFPES